MTESELEKQNKKKAALYTTIIQVVLFAVLFFMVAWRAPDPPLPEYGIELNFGMDEQGSGDIQPETAVGNRGQSETPPEESQPEVKEEVAWIMFTFSSSVICLISALIFANVSPPCA